MRNTTTRFAVAAAAGLMSLGAAGTASAAMITGSQGSITADRTSGDDLVEHRLQRDTSTLYRPRDGAVTISGNVDISGITDDGALFVGLVDAGYYDANPSNKYQTYQSGAYAYFAPNSDGPGGNLNGAFGPSDGNDGRGEVVQNFGDLGGNTDIDFSLKINPDGTLSVTYAGQEVTDDYGTVKSRFEENPYSYDEFANGAYLAVEFASSHGADGEETLNYNLNVTSGGATNVPEPSELGLLALGALMIAGGLVFRRRKSPLAG